MQVNRKPFIYFLLVSIVGAVALFSYSQNTSNSEQHGSPIRKTLSVVTTQPEKRPVLLATIKAETATSISSGVLITQKGDELLVLINKHIRLPETYEPTDLVTIDRLIETTKPGMVLRKEATYAIGKMAKDAKRSGVNLVVLSAYRSYWSQAATFEEKVAIGGISSAESFSARPGHSQHQLGTAVDFFVPSVTFGQSSGFLNSQEGNWLFTNANKYGFVLSYPEGKEAITGYIYEPWHWRYVGVENAQKMIDSGLILEEYLKKFGVV